MIALPKSFVARGSLGSLGIKIATVGLAFASQLLFARLMGADQYGGYIYALAWLNVLVLAARLGTDGLLTRFAAAYAARGEWSLLRGLVRFAYRLVTLATVILGLLALTALWLLEPDLDPEQSPIFRAALLLLPASALLAVGQSLLFGLKRPWHAQLPEPLSRLLALLLAAVFYWRTGGLSAVPAMAANALALTLACVLGVRWLFRAVPAPARSAVPAGAMREWLSIALPLLAMSFLRLLLSQSDILLIGWLLDQHSAGLYAVASRLAELASFGLQAANTTLAPTFSELHATGQTARLQEIVTRSARGIFAFTLVVSLGLGAGGEFVLGLFGPEFGAALPPLLILLAGQTVNAMTGSVGYLMTMTGHQRPAAWLLGLAAALTVGLNLLLIPRLGIGGAAIASATGMGALNLSMLVFVGSRLKINSTAFARIRYGQA